MLTNYFSDLPTEPPEHSEGYNPDIVYPPGYTLLEVVESRDIAWETETFLATLDITRGEMRQLIRGDYLLSPTLALRLQQVLGIDASFWLNLESMYRNHIAETP